MSSGVWANYLLGQNENLHRQIRCPWRAESEQHGLASIVCTQKSKIFRFIVPEMDSAHGRSHRAPGGVRMSYSNSTGIFPAPRSEIVRNFTATFRRNDKLIDHAIVPIIYNSFAIGSVNPHQIAI